MPVLADLMAQSAAAAWLTKAVVDLVRQRTSIDSTYTLVLALVLSMVFNVAWTLYQGQSLSTSGDAARVVIAGFLGFLGAVAVTETQKTATVKRTARVAAATRRRTRNGEDGER